MSNAALLRIPLIYVAMVALHVSATPPNPPAKDREVLHTRHDRVITQGIGRKVVEMVCIAGALAETACLLAGSVPRSPQSQTILSHLCPAGAHTVSRIGLSSMFFLGVLITAAAGLIRYASYLAMGRLFTFEVAILDKHRLITHGPYAYVRHPSYTGVPMTVLGIAVYHLAPGSWFTECGVSGTVLGRLILLIVALVMVSITSALVKRTWKEDELMKQNFGAEWDKWAERVPYRLIPWIY